MDIPLDATALSAYAAQTMVSTMVTEGWKEARAWLGRFFSKSSGEGDAELAVIDMSEEQLAEADDADIEVLRRASVRRISSRLEGFLTRNPDALEELRSFLSEHPQASNTYTVGSQNAVATNHGQVFQSGGAQTINQAGRNS
ncbi:hypothetical protein [Umezawaea tangerina]|uniref:Uncharacterized protein n=1 Tax=Umezawaea tangerina TaxID=84725 RepID=A0A2T0SNX7_9PSEU|nr:hypothetical protein [Umezawaea tangerina]PRY35117.1 hypothetical protein CLV43_11435 [Umezawaea tangerina]